MWVVASGARVPMRRACFPRGGGRCFLGVTGLATGGCGGRGVRLVAVATPGVAALPRLAGVFVTAFTAGLRDGRRTVNLMTVCAVSPMGGACRAQLLMAARTPRVSWPNGEGVADMTRAAASMFVRSGGGGRAGFAVVATTAGSRNPSCCSVRRVALDATESMLAWPSGYLSGLCSVTRLTRGRRRSVRVVASSARLV